MGIANKYRFGEAIPMSRADIAAGTIGLGQYDNLSETEQEKCLKRDFIWKAPNIKKLKKENADMSLVWWQNEIRKSFRPKFMPYYRDPDAKRAYVDIISKSRDLVMSSTVPGKIEIDGSLISYSLWAQEQYDQRSPKVTFALVAITSALFIDWTPERIRNRVVRERFGYTPEEALDADLNDRIQGLKYGGLCPKDRHQMDPDTIYKDDEDWHDNTNRCSYVVGCHGCRSFYYLSAQKDSEIGPGKAMIIDTIKHSVISVVDIEHLNSSLQEIKDIYKASVQNSTSKTSAKRKTKFVPESLADVRQSGNSCNILTVSPEAYLSEFGFPGGEWGNWLNESERINNLCMSFNAFKNLATVLQIDQKRISLHGLSIAFGSRGHSSASAHYEPGNNVINLTKLKGAGCLAHEWGHALDAYIAKKYNIPNELATESNLSYRVMSGYYNAHRDQCPDVFWNVLTAIKQASDFQKGSKKFDELFSKSGHGYWSSTCEMFARAFDCYIADKLKEYQIIDTYLSRGADSFSWKEDDIIYRAYPVGDERAKINAAFDALIHAVFYDKES